MAKIFNIKTKRVEKKINNIFNKIFNKVFTQKRLSSKNLSLNEVKKALLRLEQSNEFNTLAKRVASQLAKRGLSKEKGLWKKYYEEAKKRGKYGLPDTFTKYQNELLEKIALENFTMIKSIPSYVLNMYKEKWAKELRSQIANGSITRQSFLNTLKSHKVKHANVIARTEAAKLQTSIIENRSTSLGSVCYIWKASRDKRTRPSHRAMEGVVVFWRKSLEERPFLDNMYGNAGEFPNCRCDTMPVFDEKDLKKQTYKYYDYRTKSINNIEKSILLSRIKAGKII